MGFRLLPKWVTMNNLERRNGRYLRYSAEFGSCRANHVKVAEVTPIMSATNM